MRGPVGVRTSPVVECFAWAAAAVAGQCPRLGPLHGGAGAGRFQHTEWSALLSRFVQHDVVDYQNLARVRRLVEVYLRRLAKTDPETFIDTDDQLAFYLNAYNAIVVHQVLDMYPVASIRERPTAFLRPYPLGRRVVALHSLHGNLLRSFADPRIHLALCNASRSGPALVAQAYTGANLQAELDAAARRFFADSTRGLRFDADTNTMIVSPLLAWLGGDFLRPHAMPRLANVFYGRLQLPRVLMQLESMLPPPMQRALRGKPRLRIASFDWRLNNVSLTTARTTT